MVACGWTPWVNSFEFSCEDCYWRRSDSWCLKRYRTGIETEPVAGVKKIIWSRLAAVYYYWRIVAYTGLLLKLDLR
ncbi:hypothetical protein Droror1_Dr00013259, partial [Drosera rotundifolia]